MKRISKTSRQASSRSPKLPDELHPIVDAVVDVVFERLRSATASAVKGAPLKRKTAKLNLPLPKQRTALAEALADLLLADLASKARAGKLSGTRKGGSKAKAGASRAKPKAKPAAARAKARR